MKKRVLRIIYRIAVVPLVFILAYLIILDGRSDPMGLGLVYAFIATAILVPLFLIIEAILISRKKKRKQSPD